MAASPKLSTAKMEQPTMNEHKVKTFNLGGQHDTFQPQVAGSQLLIGSGTVMPPSCGPGP
jgi:hypothetical protein